MRRGTFIVSALAALSVATIAACGGGDGDDDTANTQTTQTTQTAPAGGGGAAARSVTVRMVEFAFEPSDVTIKRGGTLNVENAGKISHNLTIEQGPDGKTETKKLAGTSTFLPPKSEKLTADVAPGKHAMTCTVPGHREQGMVGTITVE
jgi:plastocyanin